MVKVFTSSGTNFPEFLALFSGVLGEVWSLMHISLHLGCG